MRADISHSGDRICSDPSRSFHSFTHSQSRGMTLQLFNKWDHPDAGFDAFFFPLVLCSINLFNCVINLITSCFSSVYFFWSSLSFLMSSQVELYCHSATCVDIQWNEMSCLAVNVLNVRLNVNVLNEKTLFWGKGRTLSDIFSSWMK